MNTTIMWVAICVVSAVVASLISILIRKKTVEGNAS